MASSEWIAYSIRSYMNITGYIASQSKNYSYNKSESRCFKFLYFERNLIIVIVCFRISIMSWWYLDRTVLSESDNSMWLHRHLHFIFLWFQYSVFTLCMWKHARYCLSLPQDEDEFLWNVGVFWLLCVLLHVLQIISWISAYVLCSFSDKGCQQLLYFG